MRTPSALTILSAALLAASPLAAYTFDNTTYGCDDDWPGTPLFTSCDDANVRFSTGAYVAETIAAGDGLGESFRPTQNMTLTGFALQCSGGAGYGEYYIDIIDEGESDTALTAEDNLDEDGDPTYTITYDYTEYYYSKNSSDETYTSKFLVRVPFETSESGINPKLIIVTLDEDEYVTLYSTHNYVLEFTATDGAADIYWPRYVADGYTVDTAYYYDSDGDDVADSWAWSEFESGSLFKNCELINGTSRDSPMAIYGSYIETGSIWDSTGYQSDTWYGNVWTEASGDGWVWSEAQGGWQYFTGSSDSAFVYDYASDSWSWTTSSYYPIIYDYTSAEYVYYCGLDESSVRWYYVWKDTEEGWCTLSDLQSGTITWPYSAE